MKSAPDGWWYTAPVPSGSECPARVLAFHTDADLASATLEVGKTRAESSTKVVEHDTDLKVADLELEHSKRFQKSDDSVFSLKV